MSIDLVPFGFTPTESLVYSQLITRGPTTAYALSKAAGVARANTYQALNGLVSKGAAVLITDNPQVFKPIAPNALLALIAAQEATSLDTLEDQVSRLEVGGEPATLEFTGQRALGELVLRTAVRAEAVTCLAPAPTLTTLIPIWRKRVADKATTSLWSVGPAPENLPLRLGGTVQSARVRDLFAGDIVCLITPDIAILGCWDQGGLRGFWSSDPLLVGCARGIIAVFTG
ncbi:MAG: helix-turn-helix domain-containing protein [Gemmatimonadota bacterium]|nr:MAG: helix-turn-helix domain-containing protein [Gemmatimonadota bacterium]